LLTLVELRWHEYGVSIKRGADGLEDGEAVLATGIDDRPDGGEELAAAASMVAPKVQTAIAALTASFTEDNINLDNLMIVPPP
jgi:hypothetical protein